MKLYLNLSSQICRRFPQGRWVNRICCLWLLWNIRDKMSGRYRYGYAWVSKSLNCSSSRHYIYICIYIYIRDQTWESFLMPVYYSIHPIFAIRTAVTGMITKSYMFLEVSYHYHYRYHYHHYHMFPNRGILLLVRNRGQWGYSVSLTIPIFWSFIA